MTLTYPFWLEPAMMLVSALIFVAGMAMGSYLNRHK